MAYWKITISCWGTLWGIGTEEEARAWKAAKQSWERCAGKLEPAKKSDSEYWGKLRDLLPPDWKPSKSSSLKGGQNG